MKDGWEMILSSCAGNAYEHVPGLEYIDVIVEIGRRGRWYRVEIAEVRGSAQRIRVVASDENDWEYAMKRAWAQAYDAGIDTRYLALAVSQAQNDMMEFEKTGECKMKEQIASVQIPADLHMAMKLLADEAGMKIPAFYRQIIVAGLDVTFGNEGEENDTLGHADEAAQGPCEQ